MENVVEGRFPGHESAENGAEPAVGVAEPSAGAAPDGPVAAPVEDTPPAGTAVGWPTRETRPGGGAAWA